MRWYGDQYLGKAVLNMTITSILTGQLHLNQNRAIKSINTNSCYF